MKKFFSWALCASLVAGLFIACTGCDHQGYATPEQTKTHMAKKEKKEESNINK